MPLPGKAPEPPPGKETGKKDERKETGRTVPSQADLEKEGLLRRSKMAEEKPRTLKVLEALSKLTEPTSPADIGSIIEVSPRDTGGTLYDLGKAGLARKPDEKQSLWLITDKGRKYIANPPVLSAPPSAPSSAPSSTPSSAPSPATPPATPPEPRLLHSDVHGLPHWTPLSQL